MSNLQEILKAAEESVRTVEDPELRKIAFQEILRRSLEPNTVLADRVDQTAKATARRPKRRAIAPGKSDGSPAIRPEVELLDISPDERGLVPWSTLSADWKRFCWILESARLKKVDGLTNSEISYLIDEIFRQNCTPRVVNNLKVQIKKGMVKIVTVKSGDRDYRLWKILAAGIKEVAAKASVAAE